MYWIYFFVSYLTGMIVFSFTVIVVLIILFFSLPTTKKLAKLKLITQPNKIIQRDVITLILLSSVFIAVTWVIYKYFPSQFVSYLVGCAFSFILGMGKVGKNNSNISDYVKNNEKSFLVHPGQIIEVILVK